MKVYLYFIVPADTNAFEDPLDERSELIWSTWRSHFSTHRIYFVPGFGGTCAPSQNYEVISSELAPTETNVQALRSMGYRHGDGIDVYIFRDDISSGNGSSFCLPSSYFYLFGKDLVSTTVTLSKSPIISHEMGHCLGLLHTYEVHCKDFDGSDCPNKGDMVCDTPPDNEQYNQNGTCTPSPIPAMDYLNIMSGFKPPSCLTHFTPGQGNRMRYYLENKIGPLAGVRANDIVITGTENWYSPVSPAANVIIKPGGQLNVYAPVTMREGAHIYVEAGDLAQQISGGYLTIYSTLTAACDYLWEGVVVAGYSDLDQTALYQGRVSVKPTGKIEHARCGVRAQGRNAEGQWQVGAGGGGVSSSQGKFHNNLIDVNLLHYQKDSSRCVFSRCEFLTTDAYRGEADETPLHLRLESVRGVRVSDCTFRDNRTDTFTDPSTRGTGIYADNASAKVYGGTEFANLFEGIHITSTLASSPGNSVNGSTFTDCFTGIFSSEGAFTAILGNDFSIDLPPYYSGTDSITLRGIDLDGAVAALSLHGNTFSGLIFEPTVTIGTDVYNLGIKNQNITGNTFIDLHTGTRSSGKNAEQSQNGLVFSGLSYLCNQFDQNFYFDNRVVNGSIRKEQGQRNDQGARLSSGNRYGELSSIQVAQQFWNAGSYIEYHHSENTSQELLDGFYTENTIGPFDGAPNTICIQEECPPPCDTASELASLKTQFFSLKESWLAKTEDYPTITDSLEQQEEASNINHLRYEMDRTV
ncbi:MAG: hypothetical protein JNK89_02280, partial [Saprospiraceae bacterium]|nr:hypothetical protein [Saprospiraceae bacterium]